MPYEPYKTSTKDRSLIYYMIWFGVGGSLFSTLLYVFKPEATNPGFPFGFAIGGLLTASILSKGDDYYRALAATGLRFMAFFIAVYAFTAWIMLMFLDSHAAVDAVIPRMNDGLLVAYLAISSFYLGYAVAWWRNR